VHKTVLVFTSYSRHTSIYLCTYNSDVIKDFVFEDKAKDKDNETQGGGQGQGLETEDKTTKAEKLKAKTKHIQCHYYSDTSP